MILDGWVVCKVYSDVNASFFLFFISRHSILFSIFFAPIPLSSIFLGWRSISGPEASTGIEPRRQELTIEDALAAGCEPCD